MPVLEQITDQEIGTGQPVEGIEGFAGKVQRNFEVLAAAASDVASINISNGSFETTDDLGEPLNMEVFDYPNGSHAIDIVTPGHGSNALKFIRPLGVGNGGGYCEFDYFPIAEDTVLQLWLMHKTSVAGLDCRVEVTYYDADQTNPVTSTLYSSVQNPTSWTPLWLIFLPPTNKRWIKIKLIGGHPDVDVAGDASFDGVSIIKQSPFDYNDRGTANWTISEQVLNAGTAWVNIGSTSVRLPVLASTSVKSVKLAFVADIKTTGTLIEQRFTGAGATSNENSTASASYVTKSYVLTIPIGQLDALITITQQLQFSGLGTAHGRKTNANCDINNY